MKHSKKFLSICIALAMIAGLLIPHMSVFAEETENQVWDSSTAGTNVYVLDTGNVTNFELSYKVKFQRVTAADTNLWVKNGVTNADATAFKNYFLVRQNNFMGVYTENSGIPESGIAHGLNIANYANQWLSVTVRVFDNRWQINFNNGAATASGILQSAQLATGKIAIGIKPGNTFQLDDIVLKTFDDVVYSEDFEDEGGTSDTYEVGNNFSVPNTHKDFMVNFKINFDLLDKDTYGNWEGFLVNVRQNAEGKKASAKFQLNYIGGHDGSNTQEGTWGLSNKTWENTWKSVSVIVSGTRMFILVDNKIHYAPSIYDNATNLVIAGQDAAIKLDDVTVKAGTVIFDEDFEIDVPEEEEVNRVWDSTVAKTNSYTLPIPDIAEFELNFKAKFQFTAETTQTWHGLAIKTHVNGDAQNLFKIQRNFLGSETTGHGTYDFKATDYEDQWIDVSLLVSDGKALININGSTWRQAAALVPTAAGKIIIAGEGVAFQLDDIVVKTYTKTTYTNDFSANASGTSDAYSGDNTFAINHTAPDYLLKFKVNVTQNIAGGGFTIRVRETASTNPKGYGMANFRTNYIGTMNENGQTVGGRSDIGISNWKNNWMTVSVLVSGKDMLIVGDGKATAAPSIYEAIEQVVFRPRSATIYLDDITIQTPVVVYQETDFYANQVLGASYKKDMGTDGDMRFVSRATRKLEGEALTEVGHYIVKASTAATVLGTTVKDGMILTKEQLETLTTSDKVLKKTADKLVYRYGDHIDYALRINGAGRSAYADIEYFYIAYAVYGETVEYSAVCIRTYNNVYNAVNQ